MNCSFKLRRKVFLSFVAPFVVLGAIFFAGSLQTTLAGSAKWRLNPASGDWNTAANWTPNTVPNGPTHVATFGSSNTTAVSLSADTEVDGTVFTAAATSPFTITVGPTFTLTSTGAGITNNSGVMQNFVTDVNGNGSKGVIFFSNSGTAGTSTVFTNNGASSIDPHGIGPFGGSTEFLDTSTAGNGAFINNGGTVSGALGGYTQFFDDSTAGDGAFANNGGAVSSAEGGLTAFRDSSTAGNGIFTNNSSAVSGAFGGFTGFFGTSTAANGTFTTNGAAVSGASGGRIVFYDISTAGNGTFTNNGSMASNTIAAGTEFGGNSNASNSTLIANGGAVSGGHVEFYSTSTASNSTLIANGGSGGGGVIWFFHESSGGTARVQVFDNGNLDISPHFFPGVMVGSIEGDGDVFLGANNLTIGSNNLSTTFSGLIRNGGSGDGTGGSLTKIGSATLRLSGSGNTYTGGTVIEGGRLLANNSSGSGTGPGAVTVNNSHSVLGGSGRIGGPVTVNTDAALLGGDATSASGALRVKNNLTLNPGAIIQLVLGPGGAHSSLRRTGGTWSFAPNQEFTFLDLGAEPGLYDNIITGLAGDPGGVASWTITNAGFTGAFSYDGAGNIDLNLTAASGPVLQLISAVSRKTHTGAGIFNVNLPLSGEPGVECRSSGGNHTLRFTFTNNVTSGNASVTTGTGTVSGTPTFAGNRMTVNLTGVADVQKITVTLSNVTDSFAQVLPDKAVSVNMLIGDTTGNKSVNASDIGQTKSQSGQAVNAVNFRNDTNLSGAINASDIGQVKANSGHSVP